MIASTTTASCSSDGAAEDTRQGLLTELAELGIHVDDDLSDEELRRLLSPSEHEFGFAFSAGSSGTGAVRRRRRGYRNRRETYAGQFHASEMETDFVEGRLNVREPIDIFRARARRLSSHASELRVAGPITMALPDKRYGLFGIRDSATTSYECDATLWAVSDFKLQNQAVRKITCQMIVSTAFLEVAPFENVISFQANLGRDKVEKASRIFRSILYWSPHPRQNEAQQVDTISLAVNPCSTSLAIDDNLALNLECILQSSGETNVEFARGELIANLFFKDAYSPPPTIRKDGKTSLEDWVESDPLGVILEMGELHPFLKDKIHEREEELTDQLRNLRTLSDPIFNWTLVSMSFLFGASATLSDKATTRYYALPTLVPVVGLVAVTGIAASLVFPLIHRLELANDLYVFQVAQRVRRSIDKEKLRNQDSFDVRKIELHDEFSVVFGTWLWPFRACIGFDAIQGSRRSYQKLKTCRRIRWGTLLPAISDLLSLSLLLLAFSISWLILLVQR